MRKRTRLIVLATSVLALAGASATRGEAAAAYTCTDGCYYKFRFCMWDPEPGEAADCFDRLDWCLASCPA